MGWEDYKVERKTMTNIGWEDRVVMPTQRGLVYLMGPYTSVPDKKSLMETVMKLATQYMKEHPDTIVVSPLFFHPAVGLVPGVEGDWDFWEHYSIGLMRKCDSAILLQWEAEGVKYWEKSRGIHEELKLLQTMRIPLVARFSPELKQVG